MAKKQDGSDSTESVEITSTPEQPIVETKIFHNIFCDLMGISNNDRFVIKKLYPDHFQTKEDWIALLKDNFDLRIS